MCRVKRKTNHCHPKQSIAQSHAELCFNVTVRTLCSLFLLKKKNPKKKPNHLPPEHQCWWVGGFSASVNTRLMKHPTLCRDGRTSSLGHGHSLWQITCSRLYLAAHMEDPRWDRVLCRPSLTPLASAQPLSTVYHTIELTPAESSWWKLALTLWYLWLTDFMWCNHTCSSHRLHMFYTKYIIECKVFFLSCRVYVNLLNNLVCLS